MDDEKRIWMEYKDKVLTNDYKPKNHYHLDPFFSFSKNSERIESIIFPENPELDKLHGFSFLPLIKTISKTPRFKYHEDLKEYKLSTKKRPIFLTAHIDKYIYGYYSYLLNSLYQEKLGETPFNEAPIAYRSNLDGRCNIQFSKEIFDFIRKLKNCTVVLTDVSSFFDNINHSKLKENWCKLLDRNELPPDHFKIYKALTSYRYIGLISLLKKFNINLKENKPINGSLLSLIEKGKKINEKLKLINECDLIVKNKPDKQNKLRGIPQGLSISAVLSNIYLWDFDKELNDFAELNNGLYRRYCDDIILILPGNDFNAPIELLKKEIVEKRGMIMKPSKTELAKFSDSLLGLECKTYDLSDFKTNQIVDSKRKGIQYLGFTFDGKDVLIRNSSVSRFYRKMSRRVRKTVRMAYSGNAKYKSSILFKKQIYQRYTHYGKRNFLTYVYNASSENYTNSKGEIKEGHNSKKMRKQVSRHMEILENLVNDKNLARFGDKISKRRKITLKKWKK